MKQSLLVFTAICLMASATVAQSRKDTLATKNLVKINLSSLALRNFSFQYERKVASRLSVALGVRVMPEGNIPFKDRISDLADDPDITKRLNEFETGNWAITPELRWYISRKGAPRGFYLAPFARYSKYTAKLPKFDIENTTKSIDLGGDITAITGGVLLGSQWRLSKLVYLDLWLLGPNYGSSSGNISGKPNTAFTPQERQELETQLKDLEIPLADTEVTVTSTSANVKISGPWAGIRGLGFNLAFRF
ncbi:MAG: DUF3575 domain-containing protein [Pyrinomonadaceae bacterium]|nr:DUF3575 domain-containing protein [Sphingobacteriaceae bacterium]